jgi:hypothetical protein
MKKIRKELAINELPSPVELFGVTYCFTTFLACPAIEFKEYMDAVRCSNCMYKGKQQVVSTVRASINKCLKPLFFMTLLLYDLALFAAYLLISMFPSA